MVKFRPIAYALDDLLAYRFSGSSNTEGIFCKVVASTSLNTAVVSPHSGTINAVATLPLRSSSTVFALDVKKYFPVYREDPDIENVGPTISNNDFVIGFQMKSGNEFEVHESMTQSAAAASFSDMGKVCLGSNGKMIQAGGTGSTTAVIGLCIGTFNGWVRVKAI